MTKVTDMPTAGSPAARYSFLDGLRGLAALSIAAFHIYRYEPMPRPSRECLPELIQYWTVYSWVVLPFMLVISGFVIPLSFRDGRGTVRSVANFFVRRLVRLSPPYFLTVLIVLLLHWIAVWTGWFQSPIDEPPAVGRVASHFFYAQDLLGFANLSAGMWTVCIEVQFYALFGVVLLVARWLRPIVTDGQAAADPRVMVGLFAPLAVMSVFDWCVRPELDPYVIYFVNHFFLGMVTWWALDGRIPRCWYWVTVGVWTGRLLCVWKPEIMCALIASLAIFTAGRNGHLNDWLNFRWLQYLGKISYSLYLIHYGASHVVTAIGWRLLGGSPTPQQAAVCLVAGLAASIVAAHVLYVFVEVPSTNWAARLKPAASGNKTPKEQIG